MLVIFSDGLTDAANVHDEEFGEERLIECCRKLGPGVDAEEVIEIVTRAVAEWSAGVEQFDDTTVVVVAVAS